MHRPDGSAFALVLSVALGFEFSPLGERAASALIELQVLALRHWNTTTISAPTAPTAPTTPTTPTTPADVGADAVGEAGGARPLSRVMAASLVVIGALVWWESGVVSWAIASSLVALAALLAVSTMMLPRGVLVPTAGPGAAIIAGMLGRQAALESVFALLDRKRRAGGPSPPAPERRR